MKILGSNTFFGYFQVGTYFKLGQMTPISISWIEFPHMTGDMLFGLIFSPTQGFYCGKITNVNSIDSSRSFSY